MRKRFILFSDWFIRNQRIIGIVLITLAVLRFFHLNYLNWDHGELCTGRGGVQFAYDSYRYFHGAEMVINGESLNPIQIPYIGYIYTIAFFYYINAGLEYVLILQLLLALCAAYAIFDFCRLITSNRTAGILAAGCLLVNPFIVQWHLFIHTDSMYTSMLMISVWLVYKSYKERNKKIYLYAFIAVIATMLLRPNGWLLFPIITVFILIVSRWGWKIKTGLLLLPVLILIISFNNNSFIKLLEEYRVFQYNEKGVIIFELQEAANNIPLSTESGTINTKMQNTLKFITLAIKRIAAELFPVFRPWLSWKFILRFLFWTIPFYILTISGIFTLNKNKGAVLCYVVITAHYILTGITYAEKEFRFLTFMLPFFILLSTFSLYNLWKKLYSKPA